MRCYLILNNVGIIKTTLPHTVKLSYSSIIKHSGLDYQKGRESDSWVAPFRRTCSSGNAEIPS